jgi:hypothetical protein
MLSSSPDDLAIALAHMLKRWEQDRPEQLADAILQDGIEHLTRGSSRQ